MEAKPCNVDCGLDFCEGNERCMAHNRTEAESIRSLAIVKASKDMTIKMEDFNNGQDRSNDRVRRRSA